MLHDTALPNAIPVQFDEAVILAEFPAATPALARLVAELRMTAAFLSDPSKTTDAGTRERLQARLREVRAEIEGFPTATVADIGLKAEAHGLGDGERSDLPHGGPGVDAELVTAASDIVRLEAKLNATPDLPGREAGDLPEFQAMMDLRDAALRRLSEGRSESLIGIQAKARVLLHSSVRDSYGDIDEVATSLARDLLGLPQPTIELEPDPVLAAIDEARRLFAVWDAAGKLPPIHGIDPHPEFTAGSKAFHGHVETVLLKTVPRTAEGCAALARYCGEVYASEGFVIDENERADQHLRVLDLIARSPVLPGSQCHAAVGPMPPAAKGEPRMRQVGVASHPDAALLELGQRYTEVEPTYRTVSKRVSEARGTDALNAAREQYDRVGKKLSAIEVPIADSTALTLEGLAVKARCVRQEMLDGGRPDETLLSGLIRDLLEITDRVAARGIAASPVPCRQSFDGSAARIEAELARLSQRYEEFSRVNERALDYQCQTSHPLPSDLEAAIRLATSHANRVRAETVWHALALPATTVLAFGLQARIVEHDALLLWDGSETDIDIQRCRALLHALIAAAGLSPVERGDEVTVAEIEGWLAEPSTTPGFVRSKAEGAAHV